MINDLVKNDREVRSKLTKKTDVELIKYLQKVNCSIKEGYEFASDYQAWSIGTSILRKRGYEILGPKDIDELIKNMEVE